MCIFHVLTVRGLSGSKGASAQCMGLLGNAEAPLATRLLLISSVISTSLSHLSQYVTLYNYVYKLDHFYPKIFLIMITNGKAHC